LLFVEGKEVLGAFAQHGIDGDQSFAFVQHQRPFIKAGRFREDPPWGWSSRGRHPRPVL
jgi:hypothetical protein